MTKKSKQPITSGFDGFEIDRLPLPVMLVGPDRKIVAMNPLAGEVFGVGHEGNDLAVVIENPHLLKACKKTLKSGRDKQCEVSRKIRRRRTFLAQLSPIDRGNNERGVFIAFYETTVASEAERMRAAFVADVSHELRSPLTTLIAALETLKGKAGDDEKVRKRFVELMTHEATRMHRIVDDLLALSATEAQEHIAPEDQVNITEILHEITAVLSEKAQTKSMKIKLEIVDGLPLARGNRDELYRVFHNLTDNAVKYGPENSDVSIKVTIGEAAMEIAITNLGDVIPKKHLSRLTERFYRVDKSRSRGEGGTGLGLAIVKHIVNRHVGEMVITSSKEEGTCFAVSLPIS